MSPSDKPRRAPGAELLALWRRCASLPFGRTLFDAFFAMRVPYSGALGARVRTLEPGHAVVELRDRRGVRPLWRRTLLLEWSRPVRRREP